ncbi:MAG: RDD family protein [Deltaproteobacteria bacterium]|nr:RDD family protein [Deltaproteobacteria bacterium]
MAPRSLAPRWAARLALASLLALAATTGARADDPDAAPAPSPAADETAPPADDAPPEPLSVPPSALTVNARVVPEGKTRRDAQELVLGQPILFEITVSAPRDVELFEPVKPATGSFKLLESQPGTRQTTADALTETYRFRLLPLRVGFEKIPPVEIAYRPRGATAGGSVSTEPLRFHVVGNLENEQDPALAAPPAPVPVIATNWVLVWGLSVGGAIVVAALLTLFVLRALDARFKALAPAPPPRPANEVAIERLDALDGTPDDALDGAARMATTVDILRQYLGGRYGFDALEMTTPELRRELADADLKGIAQTDIDRVLDEADLVKFARIVPSPESARAVAPKVRHVVEVTWEPPKVEVEEEQVPVLEAATQKQRVFAGAIDLGIAGALAILLFALLMVAGALEYGFTAILLVSVLLLFRDAFGRSVGKVVLGLAVVQRRDRQPPATPKQLVVRNLLLVVWPLTLVLEAMVQRRHPLGLRLGDMLAGTEVVQGGRR